MRVLITGISGFVGPRLVRCLESKGATVSGTYLGPRPELPGVELVEIDLEDVDRLRKMIADSRADRIIHLAALSHVGASWNRIGEYFRVNVLGTENLISAAGEIPVLLASSAEVYGSVAESEQPIDESFPLMPASPYAMSKAAAERLALEHGAVVVRMFNLVGPGQAPGFALPSFARQLASIAAGEQAAVIAVGNLEARRDFTHVDDAVSGLDLLSRKGVRGEIYNLGSGEALSIRRALDLLIEVSGVAAQTEEDPDRMRPIDLPLLQADAEKLKGLGWRPSLGVRQALVDLWDTVRG